MRSSTRSLVLAAGLACLGACTHGPKRVLGPPTGVAVYSRHPRFVEAKISPKGTYLAVVSVEDGVRSLTFVNLATRQSASRLRMRKGAMVGDYHWVNDQRVVVGLVMQDGDLARPVSLGEMFAVDADGTKGSMVFGFRTGQGRGAAVEWLKATEAWGSMVGRLRGDDRSVLESPRRDDDRALLLGERRAGDRGARGSGR